MRVNFGMMIGDEQCRVGYKEYPVDNPSEAALAIATDYLEFKKVMDYHGHPTFLELTERVEGLPDLIDAHLDPVLETVMYQYEAGVVDPITGEVRWTGETIKSSSEEEALDEFTRQGYYRNLRVRQSNIPDSTPTMLQ